MTFPFSRQPTTSNLQTAIRAWLANWDFVDNPFAIWEADDEPLLERYFVKRPFFDQLLASHKSTLVFAPRGGGKSATRLMVETECRPRLPTASVLAVPYIDFSPFAESSNLPPSLSLENYLPHLIFIIASYLLESLAVKSARVMLLERHYLAHLRYWLDWLEHEHHLKLLTGERLRLLLRLGGAKKDDVKLNQFVEEFQSGKLIRDSQKVQWGAFAHHLITLRDAIPISPDTPIDTSIRKIEAFVRLTLDALSFDSAPCYAIYLLIDGVDEYPLTQNDPQMSAAVLHPLLGNLRLLEMPGLVCKFFLPLEHRAAIEKVTRSDRLEVISLEWSQSAEKQPNDLRDLLRLRIAAFNTRKMNTLSELCDPSLRYRLEDEMIETARNSPRDLLRLGNLLFSEHCRETPRRDSLLLPVEWDRAIARFYASSGRQDSLSEGVVTISSISPSGTLLVRVDSQKKKVFRGAEEISMPSDREFRLIEFLYHSHGRLCSKNEVGLAVYEPKQGRSAKEGGVSDATIDQLIRRLRRRLEPNPSKPIYIITVKGRGCRLDNAG